MCLKLKRLINNPCECFHNRLLLTLNSSDGISVEIQISSDEFVLSCIFADEFWGIRLLSTDTSYKTLIFEGHYQYISKFIEQNSK